MKKTLNKKPFLPSFCFGLVDFFEQYPRVDVRQI